MVLLQKTLRLMFFFSFFVWVRNVMSEIPKGFDAVKEMDAKMADAELVRLGLMAELDAISLYEQLATRAQDPLVKKVFMDIAYEEKEHVGEFLELLKRLDPKQVNALEKGAEEVREMEE